MEGLEVVNEAVKGRCLVARKEFSPGQVILNHEPYVAVLDEDSRQRRCDGCFKTSSSLKRCSACKLVWYCSFDCQKSQWKIHQAECNMLVQCERTLSPTLQLMVRLLIKRYLQREKAIPSNVYDNYDLVRALKTHLSSIDDERRVSYAQMANLVRNIAQAEVEDIKEIAENFGRFSCNAHTICDEEFKPLGTGLFPFVSIINHSCSPNAVIVFEGKRAVVRAVQWIENNSEITVSYVELGANTASRRKTLLDQYFFHCKCSRCEEDTQAGRYVDGVLEGVKCAEQYCRGFSILDNDQWRCTLCGSTRPDDQIRLLNAEIEDMLAEANKLQEAGDLRKAKETFEKIERLQQELWHRESIALMRTRDTLFKISVSLLSWESARQWCRLTIDGYKRAYLDNNPLLGLQYFALGKLEWNARNVQAAIKAMLQAQEILTVTHGPKSKLVQELACLLDDARAEACIMRRTT